VHLAFNPLLTAAAIRLIMAAAIPFITAAAYTIYYHTSELGHRQQGGPGFSHMVQI